MGLLILCILERGEGALREQIPTAKIAIVRLVLVQLYYYILSGNYLTPDINNSAGPTIFSMLIIHRKYDTV